MREVRLQAIVFDLDDTLYPEEQFVLSGFRAAARSFAERWDQPDARAEAFLERACKRFGGGQKIAVFDDTLRDLGLSPSLGDVALLVQAYRGHAPEGLELHVDARGALKALKGRVALGLLTDGYLVSQRNKIQSLGLESEFDAVICTDEFGRERWKPHLHCFETMQRRLDLPPAAIGYVGDNVAKDFVAPNALGWATFCIRRPKGVHYNSVAPPGGEPQQMIHSLEELTRFVE